MEEKVKINKDEHQEAFERYWELFRKKVTLPNDPLIVGFSKQVFEAGFWAGTVFGTMKEVIQRLKPSSEHPSNVIGINVNHDPSKAN